MELGPVPTGFRGQGQDIPPRSLTNLDGSALLGLHTQLQSHFQRCSYLGMPDCVLKPGMRRSPSSFALSRNTLSPDRSKADSNPPSSLMVVCVSGTEKKKERKKNVKEEEVAGRESSRERK